MKSGSHSPRLEPLQLLLCLLLVSPVQADDCPQWGQRFTRNMVSPETGLPDRFDLKTGENVKWSASVGTESYSSPVIAGGKVFVGANNGRPRDPRHQGNRGILLCLDETDGRLLWQLVVPKFPGDYYLDWATAGICSPATVEGDRVFTVTNRTEVVCLDVKGMADGNDGPYLDEGRHMALPGEPPMEVTPLDADILWLFDMPGELDVHAHDAAHGSILIHGDYLYVNTSNSVNRKHDHVPSPDAPSLIVLDKNTGRLVARDREPIGPRIFHSTWSSPALGEVAGNQQVFFCGGDGVCYGFRALAPAQATEPVQTLERIWRFDCDPTAPKEDLNRYRRNPRVSPSNIKSMPVFHNNRLYVTVGGDIWWGKNEAWLQCIDATKTGDVTETALLWSYPLNRHCCSTPSIHDGLAFVSDCGRTVHCVDAETGQAYWTHDAEGEMFGSTLVADGKVYVGTRHGTFWVLAAEKEKRVIAEIELDTRMSSTPVAANGVLYLATHETLWAVEKAVSSPDPSTGSAWRGPIPCGCTSPTTSPGDGQPGRASDTSARSTSTATRPRRLRPR